MQVATFHSLKNKTAFVTGGAGGIGEAVSQGLARVGFRQSDWVLLVAVRNLFRDDAPTASVYDELLVVRPPKRIVGGLMVKF